MQLVRIIKNWKQPDLMRQTPGGAGVWRDVRFTLDTVEECDYLVVLNFIPQVTPIKVPRGNIWAILQEPCLPGIFDWMVEGHEQFDKVFTHHIFSSDGKYVPTQTCLPWHVDKTYDELIRCRIPEKTRSLSWVTTNKKVFPGHRDRMMFFEKISADPDIDIDLFGFGINPIKDKWDALAPYRYALAIENSSSDHYWTEKITDCYLTYTLPIYYGCKNLEYYFPKESFVKIDINDYDRTKEIIGEVLKNDTWKNRIEALEEARDLVLNKYQLFPFLVDHIRSAPKNVAQKDHTVLKPYENKRRGFAGNHKKVTVIVCTYNRGDLLEECLHCLKSQNLDQSLYDVIVVDNNSSDGTHKIAEAFCGKNTNFLYAFEGEQGLSHARNAGLKLANTAYVAYIDDDGRAPEDWLAKAYEIIEEKKPDIFGGRALPIFPNGKPDWFKEEYGVRGDMGETGWLESGFIVGTNIFFKKDLLLEYGGFRADLGMRGNRIGYHEETYLIHRAFKEKKKVFYSKELVVNDLLPDYKKSLSFYILSKYKAGKDGLKLWEENFNADDLIYSIKLLSEIMEDFDYALLERDKTRHPFPENYILENTINKFAQLGKRVEFFLKNGNLLEALTDMVTNDGNMDLIFRKMEEKKQLLPLMLKIIQSRLKPFSFLKKKEK